MICNLKIKLVWVFNMHLLLFQYDMDATQKKIDVKYIEEMWIFLEREWENWYRVYTDTQV